MIGELHKYTTRGSELGEIDESDVLTGTIMQVVAIDEMTGSVCCKNQDGHVTRFNVVSGPYPELGRILLLGPHRWEYASEGIWQPKNTIGIVRHLSDDGAAAVDDGFSIKPVRNDLSVPLTVGNTIEFNDFVGVVRIVSQTAIRSREVDDNANNILSDYLIDTSSKSLKFEDFGGYPQVVERARELIETQFQQRQYLDEIGARPVKGILFTGPPGTGKTYLAKIIAHESDAQFFVVSGPAIVSKWLGDTEATLRKLFEAATNSKSGRAIIFFDEIDSIAERRAEDSHEASRRLVAQLLTLMDGFDDKGKSVVVIAATNRVECLDPALTRPGRFDWEIEFGIPTFGDRLQILRVGSKGLKTHGNFPFEEVAAQTDSWSAADLTSIWVEAALIAAGDKRGKIIGEDVALAFERISRRPRRNTGGIQYEMAR